MRRTLLSCAAVAAILSGSSAATAAEPIVVSDLLRIRDVTAIDVADDGSRAVFTVRSIAEKPPPPPSEDPRTPRDPRDGHDPHAAEPEPDAVVEWEYRSHLYALDLNDRGAPPRQLTFGRRTDTSPRLSPDARRVAFTRADEHDDSKSQVWVMALDGGEAMQVTALEHGAANPVWSPDGRALLVASAIPVDELTGAPPWPHERPRRQWNDAAPADSPPGRPDGTREEIRRWLAENARRNNPREIVRLAFQDELALRDEMRLTHFYLFRPDDPAARPVRITDGFFDHQQPAFTPDGRAVVYAARKNPRQHPDREIGTDLWRIAVDGAGDRVLVSQEGWSFWSPRPSRDGSLLAFLGVETDEPAFRQSRIGVIAVDHGSDESASAEAITWLTDPQTFDNSVDAFEWMPARSSLIFTAAVEGGFPLMATGLGVIKPVALVPERPPAEPGAAVGVHAFGAGGGSILYAHCSPANPCVLRARDGSGDRIVMDMNPWLAGKVISQPAGGWINRPDGTRVQYWVMEPTGRAAPGGQKYPLVLEIHGGPSAMWGPGEFTTWHEFQVLASFGFGVVYCNPRGSGGYGYAFQKGNFQNWGDGPAGDVLAAVDQALLNEWADPERLVVTGGSYGGYLTAWVIAHDHRFKAAVAQRGVYDLATFFGEGNAWQLLKWAFGGYPYDSRYYEILRRESPFTYVRSIRTPLLIKHASQDLRTGVSQSEMLYRALKELGRDVEYVRYPDAGHDLSRTGDPRQRMDRLHRIIEFFERYVENPRPAPAAASPDR
jgi:dipeptidyl aminopeptidase/acylaminoacyl peptidase